MREDRAPGVPRLLVGLKLRLLRNRARSRSGGMFFLLFSVAAAVVAGLVFANAAASLVGDDDPLVVRTTLVVGASVLTVGWTLLPLITFGSDESLDPARLVLLPLRPAPLMRGLLLSALVGPGPLGVLLVVAGAVLAALDLSLLVLPAAVLIVLFTVALARTVSTVLAARLMSRRGRDTTVVLFAFFALAIQGIRFIDLSFLDAQDATHADAVLRWFPPGMAAQAVVDASDGRLGLALLELLPAALLVPVLLVVWRRALDGLQTTVSAETAPTRRHREPTEVPLLFRRLPVTPATPTGAVTARELRYVWREPRHKVNLVNTILLGVGFPVFLAIRSGADLSDRAVLLSSVAGYLAILGANNQFGFDGAATWLDVTAGDTTRALLIGKNVATATMVLPVVLVVGLLTAAISGGWAYLPGAILLGIAGLGAGLATADVVSVRYPIALPDTKNPFGGSGGGQGCATSFVLTACVLLQALLVLPVGLAGVVGALAGPAWLTLAAVLAVAYGVALWWGGLAMASRYGSEHEPERIVAVDPNRTNRRTAA